MSSTLFHSLESEHLCFKQLDLSDAMDIHEFASDENVSKYIGWPLMYSLEETQAFVNELINKEKAKTHLYAGVVDKGTGCVIGSVVLFSFDEEANNAEIGYVFSSSVWGKGYGSEAVGLVTDFGLKVLGLHKINARVVAPNIGSSKVLLKHGYVQEGQLRDYYYIDHQYYDCLFYGKIK